MYYVKVDFGDGVIQSVMKSALIVAQIAHNTNANKATFVIIIKYLKAFIPYK